MRRKRSSAAVLCLVMALSLFGCGKKAAPPSAEPAPQPASELSQEDMAPVSAMASELSAQQMRLLTGSIEVSSDVAESGGVKVTPVSAMGDGCYNCFNLALELPKAQKQEDWGFQSAEIDFGDPSAPFAVTGMTCTQLEDDAPRDNKYSLRVVVAASRWDDESYALVSGKTCTLKLENIVSPKGKVLYKGQWSFTFKYTDVGEHRQLITSSLPQQGVSQSCGNGEGSWAELSSLVLSSFSIECRFKLLDKELAEPTSYGLPYVELKNGERQLIGCDLQRVDGDTDIRDYYLIIPVELDEVKAIHLADKLTVNLE